MPADLDIAPLRSLVAVADCGGFQRAADHLHLSQAAVSQHVRRLESALTQPLVERAGRGSRFTPAGDALLVRARALLSLHDETVAAFTAPSLPVVTVGSTEHAAAQLLPSLAAALESASPEHRFRFRIDRGGRLRDGLSARTVDLALLFQPTDDTVSVPVGSLELTWFAAPTFTLPTDAVPVVAFDNPCALRSRALDTLAAAGVPAVIGAEATQLAGVQAAVGAGLGVALMATLGETPPGLVARPDLPAPEPLPLHVCARPGLAASVVEEAAAAVRPLLAPPVAAAF
jgi:DNA-binding transcriptional LysR family regulator